MSCLASSRGHPALSLPCAVETLVAVPLTLTSPPAAPAPPQMEYGGQCHISNRPYTVFRWKPGNDARYKKTIVCQEVAKAKNVCQVRVRPGRGQGGRTNAQLRSAAK